MDTHRQSVRVDPEIYLPGEIDAKDDSDSDNDSDDDLTDSDIDSDGDYEDDSEDEDELADVHSGMKRKATTSTRTTFPTKVAKTMGRTAPSTAAVGVIGDRRPDFTLFDVPVDEDVLPHPYGRHGCLYMEVRVDANKKPNPQAIVSHAFLGNPFPEGIYLDRPRRSQEKIIKAHSKVPKDHPKSNLSFVRLQT